MKNVITLSLLFAVCLWAPARLFSQISFSGAKPIDSLAEFSCGEYFYWYSDLDRDGDQDLIIRDQGDLVSWYEHDENHHVYIEHHDILNGATFDYIIPYDLNQDGWIDLICRAHNNYGNRWKWYKNLGNGSFDNGHSVVTSTSQYKVDTYFMKPIDFDKDGDIDIVYLTKNFGSQKIDWVKNDGAGNFSVPENLYSISSGTLSGFTLEDINDDENEDLVYTERASVAPSLYVALNDGTGHFPAKKFLRDSTNMLPIVVDVDNDNRPDIITLGHVKSLPGSITWYRNDGDGLFTSFDLPGDWQNYYINYGDFDNDGDIDIVSLFGSQFKPNLFRFFRNNNGVFEAPELVPTYIPSTQAAVTLDVYDWNEDGVVDAMITYPSGVSVCENDGTGNFAFRQIVSHDGTRTMDNQQAADMDGDGKLDIVGGKGSMIYWYRQAANEVFDSKIVLAPDTISALTLVADLDHDNDADIVRSSNSEVYWFSNDGAGHFSSRQKIKTGVTAVGLMVRDLNADGAPDIVYRYFSTAGMTNNIVILLNDGNSNFVVTQDVSAGGIDIKQCELIDLDGDTDLDLYYSNASNELFRRKNDGTGHFADAENIATLPEANINVVATDMNKDGDNDIFFCSATHPYTFYTYVNDGFGAFNLSAQNIDFDDNALSAPVSGDLDHDGDQDIIFGAEKSIIWMENDGTGLLEGPKYIEQSSSVLNWRVYLKDMNSDGRPDIVALSGNLSKLVWFENQSVVSTQNATQNVGKLQIAPNPGIAETTLSIPVAPQNKYLVSLLDVNGKIIRTENCDNQNHRIQRNGLPAGTYFVCVHEAQSRKLLGIGTVVWK